MRCVSDNGATAPISALTYAFSLGSNRGRKADDSVSRVVADRSDEATRCGAVNRSDSASRQQRRRSRRAFAPSPWSVVVVFELVTNCDDDDVARTFDLEERDVARMPEGDDELAQERALRGLSAGER